MVLRKQELETRLVATDHASKVIDKVADELDALEKRGDTAIEITAEDKASAEIRTVSERLAGLSDEDKTIVLKAQARDAEKEIDRILRSLARVEQMDDEEVTIRVEALGNARAELDRIQKEAKEVDRLSPEVNVDVQASGLDDVLGKLDALPGALGEITTAFAGGGGIAAGAAAVATAFVAAADSVADAAIEAKTLSSLTGDTVEDASRLQVVWKRTGAEANDLADVILQMNGVLADSPELARQLGINLKDGATGSQRMAEVIEKVRGSMLPVTEQAILLGKVFGEEGVRQVAKLETLVGTDLLRAMRDVAEEQVMSEEDVRAAEQMKASVAEMRAEFDKVAVQLGREIVPLLGEAAGFLSEPVGEATVGELLLSGIGENVTGPLGRINSGIAGLKHLLGDTDIEASLAPDAVKGTADGLDDATTSMGSFAKSAERAAKWLNANARTQTGQKLAEDAGRAAQAEKDYADALAATNLVLSQRPTVEGAVAGIREYQDRIFGLSRIAAQAETAYDALDAAITQNGFTFDLNSEKGRANQQVLEQLGSSLIPQVAAAFVDADGDINRFASNMDALRSQVFAQLRAETDLTDREIADVLNRLGMFDGSTYSAQFNLLGTADAEAKLAVILPMLETLDLSPDIEKEVALKVLADDPVGAVEAIQRGVDALPDPTATVQPKPPTQQAVDATMRTVQRMVNGVPINVTAKFNPKLINPWADAGSPSMPWPGGIAAEIGPEIINRRYLAMSPTYVPPGTHVTSRRQTARILRTRGTRGLRRYDQGGVGRRAVDGEHQHQHHRDWQPLRPEQDAAPGRARHRQVVRDPWLARRSRSPGRCARSVSSGSPTSVRPSRTVGWTSPATCMRPSCSRGGNGSTTGSNRAPPRSRCRTRTAGPIWSGSARRWRRRRCDRAGRSGSGSKARGGPGGCGGAGSTSAAPPTTRCCTTSSPSTRSTPSVRPGRLQHRPGRIRAPTRPSMPGSTVPSTRSSWFPTKRIIGTSSTTVVGTQLGGSRHRPVGPGRRLGRRGRLRRRRRQRRVPRHRLDAVRPRHPAGRDDRQRRPGNPADPVHPGLHRPRRRLRLLPRPTTVGCADGDHRLRRGRRRPRRVLGRPGRRDEPVRRRRPTLLRLIGTCVGSRRLPRRRLCRRRSSTRPPPTPTTSCNGSTTPTATASTRSPRSPPSSCHRPSRPSNCSPTPRAASPTACSRR